MEPEQNLFAGKLKLDSMGKQHLRSIAASATVLVIVALVTYLRDIWLYLKAKDVVRVPQEGFMNELINSEQSSASLVIMIVLGLVINFFLVRYIMLSKNSIRNSDTTQLSAAIRQLKTYFIIFVIVLILVAAGVSIVSLVALTASS